MTAIEMQFVALGAHKILAKDQEDAHTIGNAMDLLGLRHLPLASAYAWSREASSSVWMASRSLPTDIVLDGSFFSDIGNAWWWFDEPLPIPMVAIDDPDIRPGACALLLADVPGELRCVDYRLYAPKDRSPIPGPNGLYMVQFGRTLSDYDAGQNIGTNLLPNGNTQGARSRALTRFLIAASVWLRQRIIAVQPGHIERHRRKQLARENAAIVQSDVKVVQLRRYESQTDAQSSNDAIDWSCRWIVNGHWRNQYHPSTGKHELKYILPYVKGPEDKPLKVPTHTVYAVNR